MGREQFHSTWEYHALASGDGPPASASLDVRLIGSNTDNPGGAHDRAIVRLEATVRSEVAYTA